MIINKRNFIDYSLLLMVIAISGIPYFKTTVLFVPVGIMLIISFLMRGHRLDKEFIIFLVFLTIVTLFQTYVFNFFSLQTILGVYLRVIIGYLIIKILDKKFFEYYVNILYYLAIMGTVVFLSVVIFPFIILILKSTLIPLLSIFNFSGSIHDTIIIYNFYHLEDLRNSGPFWEPGAFSGYILIAIIFIHFNDNIINKNRKLLMLLFALITAFSTTAFLALGVFLFFYYSKAIKNTALKLFTVVLIIFASYYAFFSFDFLGQKIESQLIRAEKSRAYGTDTNTQRFLNILRDVEDFKGHELVGRGSNPLTRYAFRPEKQIRTVGITDIIVRMGIPLFLVMLYFLSKSICLIVHNSKDKEGKIFCFGTLLSILITLMSEVYFNFPLYWSLLFVFLIYKPKKELI